MSSIVIVALVCATGVLQEDCTRQTAVDVITQPAQNMFDCMLHGQTAAAATDRVEKDGTYLKIRCETSRARTADASAGVDGAR